MLPLKSLDAGENYLGLGIADAVIRRINQTGELKVRPTSAVRRYLNEEVDALTAARQLQLTRCLKEASSVPVTGLRVSVNLLRTSDGMSLWTDQIRSADDRHLHHSGYGGPAAGFAFAPATGPVTTSATHEALHSNPIAYDFYLKRHLWP